MIPNPSFNIDHFNAILAEKPEIVVTTHINPDGDAMGSLLGLYQYFKKLGYTITAITPNEYPEFLHWLPGNNEVIDYSKNKKNANRIIANCGLLFQLDYNDIVRCGDMKEPITNSAAYKVMIDHHPDHQLKNQFMISSTEVSSTSELIFEFISRLPGFEIMDQEIAECIYTGIMTDTGCFNFNSSRPRTFEIVSQLLKFGIRKDEIYRQVYDNFSEHRMRLLGYCLNDKMQVFPEYNTAIISLSQEEQDRFKFVTGDSEGFVNYPLSIKGICFSALFTERKDKVRISFRSHGNFAVNSFSEKYFGGGGHLNAAGGESNLPLQETIQKFINLLPLCPELNNL
jgi:bifunctional oligoribonuclease and PAP phosphatase NrnA